MDNHYSLEDLILIGINNVLNKKRKCSYGDLINELFSSYPNLFSIADYPKWPDTLKLDRPLRTLRSDRLVTGSPITFYSLTPLGSDRIRFIKKKEKLPLPAKLTKPTRSPSLTIFKELEQNEDFKSFIADEEHFTPNNMRIRSITKFTLETPKKVILTHLNYLKNVAHQGKKQKVEAYLSRYIVYISSLN